MAAVRRFALAFAACIATAAIAAAASSPADDARAGAEFFEKEIRPILVENCYSCHSASAKKIKGGLRLDTRQGLRSGGDDGPVIVPGRPESSLLIKAVRYADPDLQMPPKNKKLPPRAISALEAWVKIGAPDPRTASAAAEPEPARSHWAFQPVRMPPVPPVKNWRWVKTPVDAFVLANLEARGLRPAPPADRRTLIRRATFDLIGLPPTIEETRAFEEDSSPDAFAKVVDRLLASPHYGERWGRYWLDIARYADTKGYVFEEERRYPYAYTYRDYVIRSFNEDLPFNRFIVEQIAADLLPLGPDKRPLAALGFLTLGRRFLNNQPDIIDDRLDVVSRGLMGLTLTCARCHDHKYDPIAQKDYYALYGVFASCSEPAEEPLLGAEPDSARYRHFVAEHAKRKKASDDFLAESTRKALDEVRQRTGDYLLTAFESSRLGDPSKAENLARRQKLDPAVARRWQAKLQSWRQSFHPIFAPWFAYADLARSNAEFALPKKPLADLIPAGMQINPLVARALADPPADLKEAARRYGDLFAQVESAWQKQSRPTGAKASNPAPPLKDPAQEALRQILYGPDSPDRLSDAEVFRLFNIPTAQKARRLRRELDEFDATDPGAPARAMALEDNPAPFQPHVFLRGNPNNIGPAVPRRFIAFLSGPNPAPFRRGSGRLELAAAIASPQNPLTARVLVNRVWLHHFGRGLVSTPSDFGMRADAPPELPLLNYLAARFMADGWSIKKLHRLIMLSSVYQESSEETLQYAQEDPSNNWLGHMNRQRLDFEAIRDCLLDVAGTLDMRIGGRSVEIANNPSTPRRTVYGFIERQNLPSLFRTFDFATPDSTSAIRFVTTIPQQGLFMLNSPFVINQARQLVRQLDRACPGAPPAERVRQLYLWAYQRTPAPEETKLALDFLAAEKLRPPPKIDPPIWQYGYGAVDRNSGRVIDFHPLPHFTGSAWQGGGKLPDPALGPLRLTADGGHPGKDWRHAAIRRWTAPASGLIEISGVISHGSEKGDGIEAQIISSRRGQLASALARHSNASLKLDSIEVQRGDTIDFVVDCRASPDADGFQWAPVIRWEKSAPAETSPASQEWSARSDFAGPAPPFEPLSPWEKYAQVILMSNELAFLD